MKKKQYLGKDNSSEGGRGGGLVFFRFIKVTVILKFLKNSFT